MYAYHGNFISPVNKRSDIENNNDQFRASGYRKLQFYKESPDVAIQQLTVKYGISASSTSLHNVCGSHFDTGAVMLPTPLNV